MRDLVEQERTRRRRVLFTIDHELLNRSDTLAQELGLSRSALIRVALRLALEHYEADAP